MPNNEVTQAVAGDEHVQTDEAVIIGKAARKLEELAEAISDAKDTDSARYEALRKEQKATAADLSTLKAAHEEAVKASADKAENDERQNLLSWAQTAGRSASKAGEIGQKSMSPSFAGYQKGAFLYAVHEANARDGDRQHEGKRLLGELAQNLAKAGDAKAQIYEDEGKATLREEAWGAAGMFAPGYEKSTIGDTDAAGGWIIPNAIVDEFIAPPRSTTSTGRS